jgi:hypothetical protein
MDDVFVLENFFDHALIDTAWTELKSAGPQVDFIDKHGVFKGQLISQQLHLEHITDIGTPAMSVILKMIKEEFKEPILFRRVNYQTLHLPWDIHSDWTEADKSESYYNLLIPLHDVDSRTIIFDQRSIGTKHFYKYKEMNAKLDQPIPQDFWDENLSMCWPEDREYLSVKFVCPYQRRGQLVGFKRDYYHSSDSFHLRGVGPKHFIQILVDRELNQ